MANSLRSTIDASVQADPYKFYTYAQYQSSLTTNIAGGGPPGSTIPGLQNLMDARSNYFSTNSNYILVSPTITSTSASSNAPTFGETIYIAASCSNETTVYLGYRNNHQLKFNRVQMFDDGAHGDGAAGDHVFGYQVTIDGAVFEYYIYAENSSAGIFSPQRAEHEFHNLTVSLPFCNVSDVLINEIVASNSTSAYDLNGESDDWVELYNTTSNSIDLSGMYLSDDATNLIKWAFPIGTSIPANGYLLVWCDNDIGQAGIHTNFKLSSFGENLIFSNGATIYDQVVFGVQTTDVAYARCPDGSTDFANVSPTPLASNNCLAGIETLSEHSIILYPNPSIGWITIKQSEFDFSNYKILALNGVVVENGTLVSATQEINLENLQLGYYLVCLENEKQEKLTIPLLIERN
jgi:hypothetical protein